MLFCRGGNDSRVGIRGAVLNKINMGAVPSIGEVIVHKFVLLFYH